VGADDAKAVLPRLGDRHVHRAREHEHARLAVAVEQRRQARLLLDGGGARRRRAVHAAGRDLDHALVVAAQLGVQQDLGRCGAAAAAAARMGAGVGAGAWGARRWRAARPPPPCACRQPREGRKHPAARPPPPQRRRPSAAAAAARARIAAAAGRAPTPRLLHSPPHLAQRLDFVRAVAQRRQRLRAELAQLGDGDVHRLAGRCRAVGGARARDGSVGAPQPRLARARARRGRGRGAGGGRPGCGRRPGARPRCQGGAEGAVERERLHGAGPPAGPGAGARGEWAWGWMWGSGGGGSGRRRVGMGNVPEDVWRAAAPAAGPHRRCAAAAPRPPARRPPPPLARAPRPAGREGRRTADGPPAP
jgi:hypothetical protein